MEVAVVGLVLITAMYGYAIKSILNQQAAERKDLTDKLVAKDLTEVKAAQRLEEGSGPRVVSKRDNEARMAKEAQHIAERGN